MIVFENRKSCRKFFFTLDPWAGGNDEQAFHFEIFLSAYLNKKKIIRRWKNFCQFSQKKICGQWKNFIDWFDKISHSAWMWNVKIVWRIELNSFKFLPMCQENWPKKLGIMIICIIIRHVIRCFMSIKTGELVRIFIKRAAKLHTRMQFYIGALSLRVIWPIYD